MHKSNEDCFYFLTSSCAKGSLCTYRHSPLALTCNVVCPSWLRGNCLDPACPFRHTTAQRPMISNGILCFYENTPTGCLKLDCTFIHSRPRMNLRNPSTIIRPSSTNLIKKDVTKSTTVSTTTTTVAQATPVSNASVSPSQPTSNESRVAIPINTIESSPDAGTPLPIAKIDPTARRIAVQTDVDQSNDTKNSSDNSNSNPSIHKSNSRSLITDSPKKNQDETTATQSRLVVNRNVVITDPTSGSNRKIVQTTSVSPSNRVVVSSDSINPIEKDKKTDTNLLVEQENDKKKFKKDTSSSIVEIPFPCSAPSITNRVLLMPSKETTPTNTTKPIRLKRDHLPTTKISNGSSPNSISTASNEEKISSGTVLLQDDERRTMRLERFQKKPTSPPGSTVGSNSITTVNNVTSNSPTTNRNVITAPVNDRKRTIPETKNEDIPPAKRISASPPQTKSSNRQPVTPLNTSTNSSSTLPSHEKRLENKANVSIQNQSNPSKTPTQNSSVVSSPVRSNVTSRLRPPPSTTNKRPLTPMTTTTQTSTKSIEPIPIHINENKNLPSKRSAELQTPNEDDENKLLKLNESADVVDTFALIDEALLEADNILELL